MTALALSLHLLAADPVAAPVESFPRDALALSVVGPARREFVATAAIEPGPHRLARELLFASVGPLAVHSVLTAAEVSVVAVFAAATIGKVDSLQRGALISLITLGAVEELSCPLASSYLLARGHGDTSANAVAIGYFGGLVGEIIGFVPAALLLHGRTNFDVLEISALLISIVLDTLTTAVGSVAAYHLAATPWAGDISPAPAVSHPDSAMPSGPHPASGLGLTFEF